MNTVEIEQFGDVEAIKLGYGPLGPPLMCVYFYMLDGLVIDTGQSHMQKAALQLLEEKRLQRILLTHHHEDHSGNAAAISRQHAIEACGHPLTAQKMALDFKILPYQKLVWGKSEPLSLLPLDSVIESNRYQLLPVHTPGHSKDHTVYLEKNRGWLFAGDLYLGQHIKYFRSDEIISDQIHSLKKVLKLEFDALFCAHNPSWSDGKSKLKRKLQFLEDIVGQVQKFKTMGMTRKAIVRQMDPRKDKLMKLLTMGNISYANMLRSAYQSD